LAGVVCGVVQSVSVVHVPVVVPSLLASEPPVVCPLPPLPPPQDPVLSETTSAREVDSGRSHRLFLVRAR
jgi:hypothetical protein